MSWDAADALASAATAVLAALVIREARSIRTVEWLSKSVAMWQEFNALLLAAPGRADRWHDFLEGRLHPDDFTPEDRHVLYTYTNIIFTEYRFAESRLLDRKYALTSVLQNLRQLSPAREQLGPMLLHTGYDEDFVRLLMDVDIRDDLEQSWWVRWRRRRLAKQANALTSS